MFVVLICWMRLSAFWFGLMLTAVLVGCAPTGPSQHAAAPLAQQPSAKDDTLVLDVRTAEEYHEEHLRQAVNIPIDDLEAQITEVAKDKTKPLLVHCESGVRSARARKKLEKMGYTQVKDLGSYENAKKVTGG